MRVLGVNAIYHDPSAALVVDGTIVAACLSEAELRPDEVDAVAYSFDPALSRPADDLGLHGTWDHLRTTYAEHAPGFLAAALPGLDPHVVPCVPHHVTLFAPAVARAEAGGR